MEVIELLSDDEVEGSPVRRHRRRFHRSGNSSAGTGAREAAPGAGAGDAEPRGEGRSPAGGDGDVIVIDGESRERSAGTKPSSIERRAVANPYAKRRSKSAAEQAASKTGSAEVNDDTEAGAKAGNARPVENPYEKKRKTAEPPRRQPRKARPKPKEPPGKRELQAGLLFEEDDLQSSNPKPPPPKKSPFSSTKSGYDEGDASTGDDAENDILTAPPSARAYAQHQLATRTAHGLPPVLYHDPDFAVGNPAAVDGTAKGGKTDDYDPVSIAPPKCRCRPPRPCKLAYSTKAGPNLDRPYYCCTRKSGCNHFSWAFTSHMLHWYRFGPHNGHVLVKPQRGFRAEDLVQGKVGDCWFLSALAVVAEREDLIGRLIGAAAKASDNYGVIEVKLFVDGYWKTVIVDDFLPCLIDQRGEKEDRDNIQLALQQSLVAAGMDPAWHQSKSNKRDAKPSRTSSKFDSHAIADRCQRTLDQIHDFLHHDRFGKDPSCRSHPRSSFGDHGSGPLDRRIVTSDLAYSKARHNQLWVPFVEKAYAKIHGSYRAISGGHVEEAFLDLTGAPTAVYNFDHHDFNPRRFWGELLSFRRKRFPMGCGTDRSQAGIVGMHAYSILDVREVKNVGADFFRDKLASGTLGNVSGFTELDGTVRLLRIRNPHGQGEGEFSDKSPIWERLMANKNVTWKGSKGTVDLTAPQSPELKRTMVNDGTFWIDYDSFLMGFSNVDVVLAFQGNHAKSFGSSFPTKKSNHRCTRAFEVSAVGRQPGEGRSYNDKVEIFVMCIQKTRRGASLGRVDRKKSYKASDVGILVGERSNSSEHDRVELGAVDGRFFGLNRNGHIRLQLNRSNPNKRLIVMPVSFGHPSATDEERSFVIRVVADSPLLVNELSKPPEIHIAMDKFCFGDQKVMALGNAGTSRHRGTQGAKTVLMECKLGKSFLYKVVRLDFLAGGGGAVLLYLIVNKESLSQMKQKSKAVSFSIEINCRGMVCRTVEGLVTHEVISKGKKFEAAWRRFSLQFNGENRTRLLAAVVQGGQDHQMGSIKCSASSHEQDENTAVNGPMSMFVQTSTKETSNEKYHFACYDEFGIFASVETSTHSILSDSIDLSMNSKNPHEHQFGVIELDNSTNMLPGIGHDLDAAILASIKENHRMNTKEVNDQDSQSSFCQDIEKAIALSLQKDINPKD
ncbi:hypothetical protein ACHAWF_011564 [Thalassiosira exigua]